MRVPARKDDSARVMITVKPLHLFCESAAATLAGMAVHRLPGMPATLGRGHGIQPSCAPKPDALVLQALHHSLSGLLPHACSGHVECDVVVQIT